MLALSTLTPRRATKAAVQPPDLTKAAYAYLARYSASSAHLRLVLTRRLRRWARLNNAEATPHLPLVDQAVAACARNGLLDDAAYAANRAAMLRQRGWPWRRIAAALNAGGLSRDEVAEALRRQPDDADTAAAARYAERRRLGPWRRSDRAARRDRDIAAMMRAGFNSALARRTIDADPEQS